MNKSTVARSGKDSTKHISIEAFKEN